ncbi:hypothetical protein DFH94DRAFT_817762 [Russula ochroleuca]|uniref:Ndc10 domain-containing protein n=1 Tax=Russula ochroleuca TaxID=152965 RepID=A0A9P5JVN6_9AGAM|nr:hypothetical protein DFH94DRAFT_817762 [Russula ochroleuca]
MSKRAQKTLNKPASALTRKQQCLDHDASVAAEAVTAFATRRVSSVSWPMPSAGFGNNASESPPPSHLPTPGPYAMFGVHSDLMQLTPIPEPSGLKLSLARLESESHAVRLKRLRAVQGDSQTGGTYAWHLTRYRTWWESDQASCCGAEPGYTPILPFPVTAAKAVMYLEDETTQEKHQCGCSTKTVPRSTIRKSAVSQAISTLENWCVNHHHEYKGDVEAQINLWSDNCIKVIEDAAKRNEPKHIESLQALKAAGTSSDTYTPEELVHCSQWCLAAASGPRGTHIGARDRAMLLFSTSTAFRGESAHILQWSNLFVSEIPMDDISSGFRVPVLAALADNAKHNKDGQVDEHGALCHRNVDLCPVGAIAMMFFSYFHILSLPVPCFEPDFTNRSYGEYGYRSWYEYYVFSGERVNKQMSYDNHRDRVKLIHLSNDVNISKVTHAARPFAAQTARSHGASVLSPQQGFVHT